MLIRRETPGDIEPVHATHAAAFADRDQPLAVPAEAGLVDALRRDPGWIPALSLVAVEESGSVIGHVVCTRGMVGTVPALGLGPLGVHPKQQGRGVGSALMHAVLGAADALNEPVVVLLGHTEYYPRFGFRPASELGIGAPIADWGTHFQARALSTHDPSIRGPFSYAEPFNQL